MTAAVAGSSRQRSAVTDRRNDDSFPTSATLLLRLHASEPTAREIAWREFEERYGPIIAGFARKLHAPPQDIEDVVQDVLTGFFGASPTFVYDPAKGRFRGYLKTCTWNALQKRVGRTARFRAVPIENVDPEELAVDQLWNDVWEQQQLKAALEQVREQYRDNKTFRAFEQFVILDRRGEDVAAELGMSVESVYKAKERVSAALREKLAALIEERG